MLFYIFANEEYDIHGTRESRVLNISLLGIHTSFESRSGNGKGDNKIKK